MGEKEMPVAEGEAAPLRGPVEAVGEVLQPAVQEVRAAAAMPVARGLSCPKCGGPLPGPYEGTVRCGACGWKGGAYLFDPLPVTVERAEQALSEDATCINHPTKKATAVCAGTGDYICALCAVELNGETYSAAYLDGAGKEKVGKAFDRYLERPDNTILTLIILCFIPYVNLLFIPTAPFWIPYAIYLYFKSLRMRRENPLFARVFGMGRVVMIPIFLGLVALGVALLIIGILMAVVFHHRA